MRQLVCPECGAEFSPNYPTQVCCCPEHQRARARRLRSEINHRQVVKRREAKKRAAADAARARQVRRARLDLEYAACRVPVTTTEERGVIIERRGSGFYGGRVGVQSSSWRRENHHSPTQNSNSNSN